MTTYYLLPLILLYFTNKPIENTCLTAQEKVLYDMIMEYRKEKGLPNIPISKSLTLVAQTHAKDLQDNNPVTRRCNLHSWSGKGSWSRCCYTEDHKKARCMWDKPKELTNYQGNGYEIAHWHSLAATPISSLGGWKKSKGHNMLLINRGIWKKVKWKAIGIGIHKNYAVVWFGEEADNASSIEICR